MFLSLAATLLPIVLHAGKTASIFLSNSLDTFLALKASAPLLPICPVSSSKNSGVFALLDLNHDATLSIQPSSSSLLISNFLFLFVSLPIVFPTPPITPVKSAPSVPNLTLFNISRAASGSSPLSISVGPPSKSPKLPMSWTSPTKTPSPTPPAKAPAMN